MYISVYIYIYIHTHTKLVIYVISYNNVGCTKFRHILIINSFVRIRNINSTLLAIQELYENFKKLQMLKLAAKKCIVLKSLKVIHICNYKCIEVILEH